MKNNKHSIKLTAIAHQNRVKLPVVRERQIKDCSRVKTESENHKTKSI